MKVFVTVAHVIYSHLTEPMTRHRIAKLCKLDGREAKQALDELVKRGAVTKSGGGAGTKYWRAQL